ncbi:CLUMA_CG016994, isoform A [Clunio marinus]|uniref:CLUMA_CG016994, isoform A n=1 Tax=Clunio marinus TaxID=568069 RepID=A0A1J1IVY5_9DIPT|nr:CLUMA_CG016994, isoform A [Clunio marinus]
MAHEEILTAFLLPFGHHLLVFNIKLYNVSKLYLDEQRERSVINLTPNMFNNPASQERYVHLYKNKKISTQQKGNNEKKQRITNGLDPDFVRLACPLNALLFLNWKKYS